MLGTIIPNFQAIQITIFILWSVFESLNLFERKRFILGSSIIALAINIKLLPLLLLPYLLYQKKYQAVLCIVAFLCLYLFLPYIILDFEYSNLLHSSWWNIINPLNKEHVIEYQQGFYSISAIIPAYFADIPTDGAITTPRNIMSLSDDQINLVVNAIRVLLMLSVLIPIKSKVDRDFKGFVSLSYLCFLIPLIFPHQRYYSFFFMAPIIIFLTYYFLKDSERITKNLFAFILFVISMFFISPIWGRDIIGDYLDVYRHYKVIPIAALLIIPAIFAVVLKNQRTKYNKV